MRGVGIGGAQTPQPLPSSGNRELDEFCFKEAEALNVSYGLRPEFGFLDDAGEPNAYAVDTSDDPRRRDGLVLFGISLAREVDPQNSTDGKLKIAAVMAHEWGHLYQYNQKYLDQFGVRFELTADYMAGWHLRKTRPQEMEKIAAVSNFFKSLGDNAFTAPSHHGTPLQRASIFERAAGGEFGEIYTNPGDAFSRAVKLVRGH